MKKINKIIVSIILALSISLIFSIESNADVAINLNVNGNIDPFKNIGSSGPEWLYCRQKGGSVKREFGRITYNAYGSEKNMNELLACWLYLLEGHDEIENSAKDRQNVIWHQDGSDSKWAVTDARISKNATSIPELTENAKNAYKKAVELVDKDDEDKNFKKFTLKNKPEGIVKLTEGNPGANVIQLADGSAVDVDNYSNYYVLRHVQLDFNYNEKGDGEYSVVENISLIDNEGETIVEHLGYRYSGGDEHYNPISNYEDYITGSANFRIYIPKDKIEADKKYKVVIKHAWKKGNRDVYSGTYQKYLAAGASENSKYGIQKMVSYSVEKETNSSNAKNNSVTIKIKVPGGQDQGQGKYVKYLYGVYQKGVYSTASEGNLMPQYDENGNWIDGYGLIGNCTTPQWDPETGECINLEDLIQPRYINGAYIGQQVVLDESIADYQYVLIYKFQFCNYSSQNVAVSQIVTDYNTATNPNLGATMLIDKFTNESMKLAWINRIDHEGSVTTIENPRVLYQGKDAQGNDIPCLTDTTTIWMDRGIVYDCHGDSNPDWTRPYDGSWGGYPVVVGGTLAQIDVTRTANEILIAPAEGSVTTLDAFSCAFYYTPQNTRGIKDTVNVSSNPVWIPAYMDISGQVFEDKYKTEDGKVTEEVNGIKDTTEGWSTGDRVNVELYGWSSSYGEAASAVSAGAVTYNWMQVDSQGQYNFSDLPTSDFDITNLPPDYNGYDNIQDLMATKRNYVVRFIYNGEKYETTTFYSNNDSETNRSRANETATGNTYRDFSNISRANFNNEIENSNKNRASRDTIYDYSSASNIESANNVANNNLNNWYGVGSENYLMDATSNAINVDTPHRNYVNLGLITRVFDLNLENSLESMDISINGVTQRVEGNGILESTINTSDINQEFAFKSSDYNYVGDNELEVWVNYKVTINNESAEYCATVNNLEIIFDERFTAIKVGNGNEEYLSGGEYPYHDSLIKKEINITEFIANGSNKTIDIHMKLNRNIIYGILDLENCIKTLEFIAEIGDYETYYAQNAYNKNYPSIEYGATVAGKLDEDSIPNNFNFNYYMDNVRESTDPQTILGYFNKEDDCRRTWGVKLTKDENPRTLSGMVFEDATEQKNLGDGNTRLGDGIYTSEDKLINNIKNIKLMDYTDENNPVVRGTFTFDENTKTYTISGFIPSKNYIVEFTYGDGTTGYYNAQDYKSTIDRTENTYEQPTLERVEEYGKIFYVAPNGADNYWYANSNIENKSVAKDIDKKMKEITLKNDTATTLEKSNNVKNDEFFKNTAETASIYAPIRSLGNTNSGPEDYKINNINLGLAERPRSELTINKEVDHINITATDGTTLIDGGKQVAKSISWTDRYVQPIVDENLIYGSTLTITYRMSIKNTGEVDYSSREFYDYGRKSGDIIKTKADSVIDYVDNNLAYDETSVSYNGIKNVDYWKKTEDTDKQLLNQDTQDYYDTVTTKIITEENNPLLKALKPGENTENAYLTLTKTLSDADSTELLTYNNYVEIIKSTNQAGRRSYSILNNKLLSDDEITKVRDNFSIVEYYKKGYVLSIPGDIGNFNKSETLTIDYEPDSDEAQEIQIIQPFGSTTAQKIIIWTSLGIISGIILSCGIYLIKKKVLDK